MSFATLLALVSLASATLLTYFYLRDANFWVRSCVGVCTGFASIGLIGFALAASIGIRAAGLLLLLLSSLPLLILRSVERRTQVVQDLRSSIEQLRQALTEPSLKSTGYVVSYVAVAWVLWHLCDRAIFENTQGIFTGLDTNLGDLPFHLSVITSFAYGENFPPQHPEFAGAPITYPFVVDFVTAMLVRLGATLRNAFVWQNFAMMLALFALIHHWSLRLLNDRLSAALTPLLVFLSGGFGWWLFLQESARGRGVLAQLGQLSHDYSIGPAGYRWGNALTTLFVPQRGILFGMGLAVIVWILWLQSAKEAEGSSESSLNASFPLRVESLIALLTTRTAPSMIAAGVIAGLMPLVHAHTFAVTLMIASCFVILQICWPAVSTGETNELTTRVRAVLVRWLPFFIFAALLGIPQVLWATHGSAVQSGNFIAWQFGWDRGTENVVWFWLKNTGFFIPLIVTALVWHRYMRFIPKLALSFCLPFIVCFILPNLLRLAPWVWDNIKVLFYWWLAAAPLVALVLVKMWRSGGTVRKLAFALLVMQITAGGLDVWRAASGTVERQSFGPSAIRFAEMLQKSTPPQALILHAPTYNDPVYLTGRRTFVGYPGHLWSHGLEYSARLNDLKSIYSGSAEAADLLTKNRIEYVVVGPLEEAELRNSGSTLNRTFFERYPKVGEEGEYRLYKIAQQ